MTFKICEVLCSGNEKKKCRWGRPQEAQVAVKREKGKERTRFCSITHEFFYIFVLFPAIIMLYLLDSV